MKNKKKIILVALALAAVAVWYFWLRKPKAPTNEEKDPATPPTKTEFSYGGKRLIVPSYN